jgi:hypothetical protein
MNKIVDFAFGVYLFEFIYKIIHIYIYYNGFKF